MYYYKYKTKVGDLYISADDNYILEIAYTKRNDFILNETKLIKLAADQIDQYLNKKRQSFDLPLKIEASKFESDVYQQLLRIDYGKTKSYKEVAQAINNEKAVRAVGNACNKNKFSIVVPCHRVVSSTNYLQGYAGGLAIKEKLLKLEGIEINNSYVYQKPNNK